MVEKLRGGDDIILAVFARKFHLIHIGKQLLRGRWASGSPYASLTLPSAPLFGHALRQCMHSRTYSTIEAELCQRLAVAGGLRSLVNAK